MYIQGSGDKGAHKGNLKYKTYTNKCRKINSLTHINIIYNYIF